MRINNDFYVPESEIPRDFIYEMSDPLKTFKLHLRSFGAELYYHVIYVCVLGNKLPYEEHWKKEILVFARPVIDTVLKSKSNNIDRSKYVRSEMMSHYMGAYFEDYDISQFEFALQCKINSAKRMLKNEKLKSRWPSIKREMSIILDVQQHLDGVPEKCFDTIKEFYDELCKAATEMDLEILKQAVEKLKPVI